MSMNKYCCVCHCRYDDDGKYDIVEKEDQPSGSSHGYCKDCFKIEIEKLKGKKCSICGEIHYQDYSEDFCCANCHVIYLEEK